MTVEYLKEPGTKANWKAIKGDLLQKIPEWSSEIPYQVKSVAIRDACLAVSRAKKQFLLTGEFQEVGFRSRKYYFQSCYIPKSAISERGIYHTLSGELKWTETLPKERGDARLVVENGRWFVCLPVETQQNITENQGTVVSLDPGIRTFLTFFSETSCGKLGYGDFGRIQRLCSYLDKLLSNIAKAKHRQKQNMKKAAKRIRWRIKNLIDELHHKVAKFLVDNFDVILLPTFETQQMVLKASRKIGSKSVRSMLTFAHYRFKQFLKHKAFQRGKIVLDCNEAYTSKTVSWTGEIVNIGGAKQIRSKLDKQVMDRDYNGARGIFLRALVDLPILGVTKCTFPVV